jgi:hypothetical protein
VGVDEDCGGTRLLGNQGERELVAVICTLALVKTPSRSTCSGGYDLRCDAVLIRCADGWMTGFLSTSLVERACWRIQ